MEEYTSAKTMQMYIFEIVKTYHQRDQKYNLKKRVIKYHFDKSYLSHRSNDQI